MRVQALEPASVARLVEIVESLAFLIPMGEMPCPDDVTWGAVVVLDWQEAAGHGEGRLWLALTADAAAEAARNMCGLPPDQDVSRSDAIEATGELANVILGNLLPLMHGAGAEFHLGAPTPVNEGFPTTATALDLGGGILAIAIETPDESP